jgi:predicted transcriptional regulator
MSQTLLEMAKDLVLAQIQAKTLPPDAMHIALQQTYTSLKALKVLEESNGSVAGVTPETPPVPVHWKKKHYLIVPHCWMSPKFLKLLKRRHENAL